MLKELKLCNMKGERIFNLGKKRKQGTIIIGKLPLKEGIDLSYTV